ncbi:MAG: NTPase KAP [Ancylobacter novellus]|uniref:NTPase KAP n=1 Tax=Ancylobacter novellus TaxID=921 RepID=A0A2W5MG86_ANCNO|nr:MAG: NTPase KAP [Ancylobacter novellus]
MWADSESDVDYLNFSEVSELICEMLADDRMLPMSLGVYGTWGVGKSSVLQLVSKELQKDEKNIIVDFDAWLYQDFDEAKAALMSVIANKVFEATPESLKDKALSLLKRTNKLRLLGLVADVGAAAVGAPTFGAFSKASSALEDMFEGEANEQDVADLKAAAKAGKERVAGLVEPKSPRNPPREIDAYRAEFEQLLLDLDRRLVIFVDNLDRCLPPKAIATLEAMRLFLFLPRTAFIVAADEQMIRHAVAKHFANPSAEHVTDYLDKLIQVPVRVPKLGVQEVRAYLFMLLASQSAAAPNKIEALRSFLVEHLRRSWSSEPPFTVDQVADRLGLSEDDEFRRSLDTVDRLASLLALSKRINGNPRIVKRMLNVVRMRTSVAKRRRMAIGEAIIAKLVLFERCTDENAIKELHRLIGEAPDGKAELLSELEANPAIAGMERCPSDWTAHAAFVSDWAQLAPPLGGVDLRPAVYLARETLAMRFTTSRLSAKTKAAIEVLVATATMKSAASKAALDDIDAAEVADAMDEVISSFGRNPDWDRTRSDVRGAVLMARRWPAAQEKLVRFVGGLPASPPWLTALMQSSTAADGGARA